MDARADDGGDVHADADVRDDADHEDVQTLQGTVVHDDRAYPCTCPSCT